MPSLFISYSSKDSKRAQRLVGELRASGYDVWIDRAGIDAATSWSKEIAEALEECVAVLLLLSPSSLASPNVAKELAVAAQLSKRIFPIELEPVELKREFLYHLSALHRISINNVDALVRALDSAGISRTGADNDLTGRTPARKVIHAPMRGTFRKPMARVISLVTALIIVGVLYAIFIPHRDESIKRVVVLPFHDLTADKANDYLSRGFSDELVNALLKIPNVKIVATATANDYQKASLNPFEIAKDLGVQYVVSGSLIKSGDSITVRVAVSDGKTNQEIAKLTYSGVSKDLFTMQEKLAGDVAAALKASPESVEAFATRYGGTQNVDAYEFFLRGLALQFIHEPDSIYRALAYFDSAIRLDSSFSRAWVGKARELTQGARFVGGDSAWYFQAEKHLERAIQLTPKLAWPYRVQAVNYSAMQDWNIPVTLTNAEIVALAEKAIALEPNDVISYSTLSWLTGSFQNNGTKTCYQKALGAIEKGLAIDPSNIQMYGTLINLYAAENRLDKLKAYRAKIREADERLIRLHPDVLTYRVDHATHLFRLGDTAESIKQFDSMLTNYPDDRFLNTFALDAFCRVDALKEFRLLSGLYARWNHKDFTTFIEHIGESIFDPLLADARYRDKVMEMFKDDEWLGENLIDVKQHKMVIDRLTDYNLARKPTDVHSIYQIGTEYERLGDTANCRKWSEHGLKVMEQLHKNGNPASENKLFWHRFYAYAGRKQEAVSVMEKVVATKDVYPGRLIECAACYAYMGDNRRALGLLQKTTEMGLYRSEAILDEPALAALQSDPQFQSIMKNIAENRKF